MPGKKAREELVSERLTGVGNLVAGFAHEIRNPLSTIGLNLQLILEELRGSEESRDRRTARRLTVVESEVKRLQAMLEEFLGFVRRPEPRRAPVDLNAQLRLLIEFTLPELRQEGLELRFYPDPAVGIVPLDADQFQAVIVNLVRNAREACSAGAQVMVATRRERDAVVVQVTDTGPGMSPEVRDKAFEPYFSTKTAGNGLGLATVRRIVEEHDGVIELTSEPGKGTQFSIRLPAPQPLPARQEET